MKTPVNTYDTFEYLCNEHGLMTNTARQVYLNQAGAAGWELVSINPAKAKGLFGTEAFTFKRKLGVRSVPAEQSLPVSESEDPGKRTL